MSNFVIIDANIDGQTRRRARSLPCPRTADAACPHVEVPVDEENTFACVHCTHSRPCDGGHAAVTLTARAERRAAEGQAAVYHEYQQLLRRAASYAVTVSENGAAVGTYTLADLGVFEGTRAAIDALYTDTERLSPEAFAARPLREKARVARRLPSHGLRGGRPCGGL